MSREVSPATGKAYGLKRVCAAPVVGHLVAQGSVFPFQRLGNYDLAVLFHAARAAFLYGFRQGGRVFFLHTQFWVISRTRQ